MIKRRKGVALLWSLVLSAVLLLVSGTMVSYIIKESQFSIRTTDSTTAYSYAKSGIEWANYYIESGGTVPHSEHFDLSNNGDDETTVIVLSGDCSGGTSADYCIESTSTHGEVTRKIEHESRLHPETLVNLYGADPSRVQVSDNNSESFELNFRFWGNHSTFFGLDSGEPDDGMDPDATLPNRPYIAMRNEVNRDGRNDNIIIQARDVVGNIYKTNPVADISLDDDKREPYEYKVTLKYINDTAASIRICDGFTSNSTYSCKGSISLDLVGKDFGNLNHLFVYDSSSEDGYTDSVEYEIRTDQAFEGSGDGSIIVGEPVLSGMDYWVIYDTVTLRGVEILSGYTKTLSLSVPNPGPNGYIESLTPGADGDDIRCGGGATDCSGTFEAGSVSLNATTTNSDYYFSGWGGDCSGDGLCTISLSADSINPVSATFSLKWTTYPGIPFEVYYVDESSDYKWSNGSWDDENCRDHSEDVCDGTKITIGNRALKSDNLRDYSDFPGRNACSMIDGRLPNVDELLDIFNNLSILSGRYWSSEQSDDDKSYTVGNGADIRTRTKSESYNIRCIRD